jgi:hypothetical protein
MQIYLICVEMHFFMSVPFISQEKNETLQQKNETLEQKIFALRAEI